MSKNEDLIEEYRASAPGDRDVVLDDPDRELAEQAAREEDYLSDEETEDPLEGDVDRHVPENETSDHTGYPDAHKANVARQHGDFTG